MTDWEMREGDCLEVMAALDAESVDSIVSDPPYGLAFMGKQWDHGVPGVPFWAEALRVAKPGAFLVAFGGTRTYHRLTCAIEDAGWEIRDCLSWLYGSGFPKSHDVSKAMDKVNGETDRLHRFTAWMRATGLKAKDIDIALREAELISPTSNFAVHYFNDKQPAIPTKTMWTVVRPLCGDVPEWVDQLVARHEAEREVVGKKASTALAVAPGQNTDRPQVSLDITAPATDLARQWHGWGTALKPAWEPIILARKPLIGTVASNVAQYGTGGINVDGCRIPSDDGFEKAWDRPVSTNISKGSASYGTGRSAELGVHQVDLSANRPVGGRWPANVVLDEDAAGMFPESRFFYTAKASRKEREAGLESVAVKAVHRYGSGIGEGLDPDAPAMNRNHHPTVKPIALMRWLCRLVTPKGGVVLDPFTGSGTTGCAAVLEGFRFVGIEREPEYVEIAQKRIAHWGAGAATVAPSLFDA
jgi:DNA modification methylase